MDVDTAWEKFKKSNQTSVEDKLDVILAQQQQILTDTSRTADLVPMVTGDKAQEDALAESGDLEGMNESALNDEGMQMDDSQADAGDNPFAFLEDESDAEEQIPSEDESVDTGDDFETTDEESDILDSDYDENADWSADEEEAVSDDEDDADVAEDAEDTEDGSEEPSDASDETTDDSTEDEEEEYISFDEIEDEENTQKSMQAPATKTIKSFASQKPMTVVSKVQKPNASIASFGRASDAESISDALYKSEDFEIGYGVDPHEQTKSDWAMYRLMKRANQF